MTSIGCQLSTFKKKSAYVERTMECRIAHSRFCTFRNSHYCSSLSLCLIGVEHEGIETRSLNLHRQSECCIGHGGYVSVLQTLEQ